MQACLRDRLRGAKTDTEKADILAYHLYEARALSTYCVSLLYELPESALTENIVHALYDQVENSPKNMAARFLQAWEIKANTDEASTFV